MSLTRRIITATTTLILSLTLTGCALLGGPMINTDGQAMIPPDEFSPKTDRQTLDEALAHTNDLAEFLGGEWNILGYPDAPFDPTGNTVWNNGQCGAPDTSRYSIDIERVAPMADPRAKIEQVRDHWESLGYRVRQIGPPDDDYDRFTEIFVDLPYGALLGFNASSTGMGISTLSECIREK